ncbi:MAG: HEAT repeat domain-containing protein [bacterium]
MGSTRARFGVRAALIAGAAAALVWGVALGKAQAAEPRRGGTLSAPSAPASPPSPTKRPTISIGERLKQLDHWNPRVRQIAAEALAAYGDDARRIAISALIATLHDVDARVRYAAAQTIGILDPPWWSVAEGLIDALGDTDATVRRAVIEQIARRNEAAVPQLVAALDSPVVVRREGAALTLAAIGPHATAARERLRQALADPNASVQQAARAALEVVGEPPAPPAPAPPAAVAAPAAPPPSTATWLVLPVPTGWAAATSIGAGAVLGLALVATRVRRQAREKRARGARSEPNAAAESLGLAEIRRALDKNLARLRDSDEERRFTGIQGLAELGARAVPSLVQVLEDADAELRYWAVAALEQIGPAASAAVTALCDRMASEDEREETRIYASHALARIGARAAPSVIALLKAGQSQTRRHAAVVLLRMGSEAEPSAAALIEALGDPDAEVASTLEESLSAMSAAVAPELLGALVGGAPVLRMRAARVLRQLGVRSPEVLEALANACNDPDPEVQREAALSLETLEPPSPSTTPEVDPSEGGSPANTSGMLN